MWNTAKCNPCQYEQKATKVVDKNLLSNLIVVNLSHT